jgi:hypothetical protein
MLLAGDTGETGQCSLVVPATPVTQVSPVINKHRLIRSAAFTGVTFGAGDAG